MVKRHWFAGVDSVTHRHRQQYGGNQRGSGVGRGEEGKGGHKYGDWRKLDFRWWAHDGIYRWCVIKLYTGKLYNQYFPINLI